MGLRLRTKWGLQMLSSKSFAFLSVVLLGFTGCNPDTGFNLTAYGLSEYGDGTPTVCDPFGGSSGTSRENGIEAKLTYLPSNATAISSGNLSTLSFEPSAAEVVTSPVRLILGQLNASTRPFTEGFAAKESGEKLQNNDGQMLDEYFSIRAQANLRLAASDVEGDYELALLSDDGSILDLDEAANGNFTRWIENDGIHANKFACAAKTLKLTRGAEIPLRMNYYQGPRVRIALMMVWRLKNASSESECGASRGDDYFFNPVGSDPSVPTANWNAVLSRGWRPLAPANFVLPNSKLNPCVSAR